MSLSGMVEIPRPFDRVQGMLKARRRSVMPVKASIEGSEGVTNTENLDSRPSALLRTCFRGKDGRGGRLPVEVMKFLGFEPRVV